MKREGAGGKVGRERKRGEKGKAREGRKRKKLHAIIPAGVNGDSDG